MANFSYTIADAVAFTRIKSADWNARFSDLKSFFNTTNNINLSALQYVSNNGYPVGNASGQVGDSGGAYLPFFSNSVDPSAPASNYIRLYSKSNKLYTINSVGTVALVGSGAGGGSINYIQNPDAESDLTGWTGYNETQQVTFTNGSINITITNADLTHLFVGQRLAFSTTGTLPTNFTQGTVYYIVHINPLSTSINVSATINGSSITAGSAGSGTHTLHPEEPYAGTGGSLSGLTFTRSLSSPLRGVASFLLTQSNPVPVNGQGVSYDFTIDRADQGKVLSVSFDYLASSDFVASSGQPNSQSDIQLYLYDVTNTQFIPISPNVITAKGSTSATFTGQFQTAATSTSYRLLVHVVTPNGNGLGWTFKFDNVSVGPNQAVLPDGTVAASAYLSTNTSVTSGTPALFDVKEFDTTDSYDPVTGIFTAPSAGKYLVSVSFQTSGGNAGAQVFKNSTNEGIVAQSTSGTTGAGSKLVDCVAGDQLSVQPDGTRTWIGGVSPAISFVSFFKVAGAEGSESCSVVAAAVGLTTNYTVSANNPIKYDTVVYDTHAAYSLSTGLYTAPVSGKYRVGVVGACTALNQGYYVAVNGTAVTYVAASIGTTIGGGSQTINAVAGDTIGIYSDVNNTTAGSSVPFSSFFSIERVSGPAVTGATETVASSIGGSTSVTTSSGSPILLDTVAFDTHAAYNVSTGKWTAPASGYYLVQSSLYVGGALDYQIFKNGSVYVNANSASVGAQGLGTTLVKLNAGDYITLVPAQNTTLSSGVVSNFLNIVRQGL